MRPIALALLLASCGPAAPPPRSPTALSPEPPPPEVDPVLGCIPPPDAAIARAECTARGCDWAAPLVCSGTPLPREREPVYRPCSCVCQADRIECMRVP